MADLKTVTDTIHGTIRLEPLTLDLLETLELQRLNSIRQLGLTYLVFPGANHSRLEHCLGVGHVAGEMAKALELTPAERKLVRAAGLLHDVGHGPFSIPSSMCSAGNSPLTTCTSPSGSSRARMTTSPRKTGPRSRRFRGSTESSSAMVWTRKPSQPSSADRRRRGRRGSSP